MRYGALRDDGSWDLIAEGDQGQVIFALPHSDIVIVHMGTEYGLPMFDWLNAFHMFAGQE